MRRLADIVKVNILLCDAEKENLKLNEQYVQVMNQKMKIDAEVYCYEDSSEELVEFIKKIRIDIAILDIVLKSGNGIDIARIILEKCQYYFGDWVYTIYSTGFSGRSNRIFGKTN